MIYYYQFVLLQTTDASKVDICTERGTSPSRKVHISIRTWSYKANKAAKRPISVCVTPVVILKISEESFDLFLLRKKQTIFKDTCRQGFFLVTKTYFSLDVR